MTILKHAELIRADEEQKFITGEQPFWQHLQRSIEATGGLQQLMTRVIEGNPDLVFMTMAKRAIELEAAENGKTEIEVVMIPYTKEVSSGTP